MSIKLLIVWFLFNTEKNYEKNPLSFGCLLKQDKLRKSSEQIKMYVYIQSENES